MKAVIYFSRRGENFVNGKMEELAVGNTEVAAMKLAAALGADLIKLEPVVPYPNSYQEVTKQAELERQQRAYVAYTADKVALADYETIFLGYPNWWGGLPQLVVSFLQENDWQNKTIYPFCTHEGSGMGSSIEELKRFCPTATVKDGLPIRGSQVARSDTAIRNWLTTIEE